MDILRKNRQATIILAGTACAAAVAGLYFLWQKSSKKAHQPLKHKTSMEYFEPSDRESILASIKLEYANEDHTILSLATIKKIIDVSTILATPAFLEIVHKNRESRRQVLEDLHAYANQLRDFANNVDTLIEKTTLEVLVALNISAKLWEDSEKYHQEHNHEELQASYENVPNRLKAGVRSRTLVSRDTLIDMMKQHVVFLVGEVDHAKQYRSILQDHKKIVNIAQSRVSDRLFEKYGIDDEDYTEAINQFSVDPSIQQLLIQHNDCVASLRRLAHED